MAKTSFYSGTGITNTEQNAIDGVLSGAQDARDDAIAAKDAAEASAASAATDAASIGTDAATSAANASAAAASASAAATSASDASSSKYAAQSYESLAATSAASAATSATSAAASAAAAQAVNVITDALVGTVTEVIPNTGNVSSTVANGVITFDFDLPRGYTGPQGPAGPQGPQGPAGADGTSYTDADVNTHLNTSTAGTNEVLSWNGSDYDWVTQSTFTNTDVDTHLNTSTAATSEVLSWNGSDYDWVAQTGGGDLVDDTTPQLGGDLTTNGHDITIADDDHLYIGTGNDLEISHASASGNTFIRETNSSNHLYIEAANLYLNRMDANGVSSYHVFSSDGTATRLHTPSGTTKLSVTTSSVEVLGNHVVTGNISVNGTVDGRDIAANIPASLGTSGQVLTVDSAGTGTEWTTVSGGGSSVGGATGVDFNDSVKARFGTSNDLEIYHDGNHSYISDVGTGDLILKGSNFVKIQDAGGTTHFQAYANNGATLLYGGSTKLNTNAGGVYVSGNVALSGTVDGRDIAANIPSSLGTSGQVLAVDSAGTATEWTDTKLDGYSVSVVSALPASPDANTIYFVT